MKKVALFTIAMMMFAATQESAALTLLNGSFETPVTESPDFTTVNNTETAGGWTASNQTFHIAEPAVFGSSVAPVDGTQYLQLNGLGGGRAFQDLGATDAVVDITLSANFYERSDHSGATYTFGLYSDNTGTTALAESSGSPGTTSWVNDSITALSVPLGTNVWVFITAVGTAVGTGAGGTQLFWVDDVELGVTATIPEPSSMLLVGLGVLGLGVVRRRRQR